MSSKLVSVLLIVVGVIHVLPLSGVLGVERLASLYGVSLSGSGPEMEILMRHRAVLFGLLGLFLIAAAFRPQLQVMALAAGTVSVIGFIWLAFLVGNYNGAIQRVVVADVFALGCLIVAGGLMALRPAPE